METGPQRQNTRAYFRATVSISTRYSLDGRHGLLPGRIDDISGGGVKLVTEEGLPVNAALTLRFSLPDSGESIDARGRVVLTYRDSPRGRYAHGVTFTAIDAAQRELIVRYVHRLHLQRLQEGRK
ncbi:MAG: PilZ domain-containing protein [bacterium]|nr:PilZ domain-containing protein [bacterium]